MDVIILGLLMLSPRTIYQLRQRIGQGLNLMYSSSMGSIQAGIKKLLTAGQIRWEEVTENGKHKKVYIITDEGREHFLSWVNSPMEISMKSPELVKVYFMGFADREARETNIRTHIEGLKKQYAILDAICREGEAAQVPEAGRDIFACQLATAQYGRDFTKFNIQWYENLLEQIRSGES